MNVVIPFHNGDAHLAVDLVKWIGQLGGIGDGWLLLCMDQSIEKSVHDAMWVEAVKVGRFATYGIDPVNGWPKGSNVMFARTLEFCKNDPERLPEGSDQVQQKEMRKGIDSALKNPWLWLEPDAIPLKRGWLDAIRKEYAACGQRYMGNVYVCDNPRLPNRLMSGIGVYPADAKEELEHFTTTQYAWDVEAARFLVENCAHTKLIHHFWGIMGMPPTFAAARTPESPPNTFTLESIHKDAVIFHRNKDGTLLELLKQLNSMTVPMPEVETLAPIKSDAELIAKIRSSVEEW